MLLKSHPLSVTMCTSRPLLIRRANKDKRQACKHWILIYEIGKVIFIFFSSKKWTIYNLEREDGKLVARHWVSGPAPSKADAKQRHQQAGHNTTQGQ